MYEHPTAFDLHGLVGIRLHGASPAEAAAVHRQLGPIEAALEREPDIVIRYEDAVAASPARPVALLGVDEVGFTDDEFLLLRGKRGARVRVAIPMHTLGDRCEIRCERGTLGVPLLLPIVNLTALARGILPLHATAFVHQGRGVLVTGWAKGGKTETLLAFAAHGASYVGDEWIYIRPDGQLAGIPEPIRLWDWQLRSAPEYRRALSGRQRARLALLRTGIGALEPLRGLPGGGVLARALAIARRQLNVQVPPARLFSAAGCTASVALDHLLLVGSHASPAITVTKVSPAEVADRMVFSLAYERAELLSYYQRFRFAFPHAANPLIEGAQARERELAHRALDGVPAHWIRHPYPVEIGALHDAIAPLLAS